MKQDDTTAYVIAGLMVTAAGAVVLYVLLTDKGKAALSAATGSSSGSSPASPARTIVQTITKTTLPAPAPSPSSAAKTEAALASLGPQTLGTALGLVPTAASNVLKAAAGFVESGGNPGVAASNAFGGAVGSAGIPVGAPPEGFTSPGDQTVGPLAVLTRPLGGALRDLADTVAQVGPVPGIFIANALTQPGGIAGQSRKVQTKNFGNAALATAETVISSAVPVVGAAASAVLGVLAKTGTGGKVVTEVGRPIERGYLAQKDLTKGDVSAALRNFQGGRTHRQRAKAFQAQVAASGAKTARALATVGTNASLAKTVDLAAQAKTIAAASSSAKATGVSIPTLQLVGEGGATAATPAIAAAAKSLQTAENAAALSGNSSFQADLTQAINQGPALNSSGGLASVNGYILDGSSGFGWVQNPDGSRGAYTQIGKAP